MVLWDLFSNDINGKTESPIMHPVTIPTGKRPVLAGGRSARIGSTAIIGLTLVALLSGCENFSKRHFTVGSVPDDYRSRHPIVISEKEQTLDVPVASAAYGLTSADRSAVLGFSQRFRKSASGAINVLIPSGSSNERAARRMARKIVAELRGSGIPRNRIIMAPYYAANHGSSAPVRLSYAGIKAGVDGCGQWPADLSPGTENKNYHNFGCATQNNLAEMVANPSDLLGPRGSTSIDAERRLKVIESYRNAEDTATVYVTEE